MTHAVEVIEPGLAVTVQDSGRRGHRAIGVPVSGAADAVLLACANALVGNAADAAALEIALTGPGLRACSETVRLALAGEVQARVERADGQYHALAAYQSVTLRRDDVLRVGAVSHGLAYLALAGGCRVPAQLGSRSTYARARLGGVAGRALAAGDRIECGPVPGDPWLEWRAERPWAHDDAALRVMPGPQADAFTPAALALLCSQPYRVGRASDRMGLRLEGPALAHVAGADIVSDGVVPGAIQVPGDGQPIVLMADAQTVGGYAKIATVIRADLPRLAHRRAGDELRFVAVTRAQALAAWAELALRLSQWQRGVAPFQPAGVVDLDALNNASLVSGMIDAGGKGLPWE